MPTKYDIQDVPFPGAIIERRHVGDFFVTVKDHDKQYHYETFLSVQDAFDYCGNLPSDYTIIANLHE